MFFNRKKERGSVLIYVLWVIGLLSVFAVNIGMLTRQKIRLLSRLEKRSQLNAIADAGIRKAIVILNAYKDLGSGGYSTQQKSVFHRDMSQFKDIELGNGVFNVSYQMIPFLDGNAERYYGVVDEQGKLNINVATEPEMMRLFQVALGASEETAQGLTNAIIDWRESSRFRTQTRYHSEEYYQNLKYSYETKDAPFESLDELLLLRGMTPQRLKQLRPFITIYGDGRVNINTASEPVLIALGFESGFAEIMILMRRGEDSLEGTADDFIYTDANNLMAQVSQYTNLRPADLRTLDQMKIQGKLTNVSQVYSMTSQAHLENSEESKLIACVYNTKDNKIEYWKEYWETP